MFHRMMNYGEMTTLPNVCITKEIIMNALPKYKRHDDLIIIQEAAWEEFKKNMPLPVVKEENSPFSIDEDELASLVCQTIQKPICRRLAVERSVNNDGYRTPNVELILGDSGIVSHKENHIIYRFDVTKCMFSFGNIREKMRMAELNCSEEIVVDLFAGIGYFSLPLLIHAKAKHLYACEWNPHAVEALKKNLDLNKIDPERYTVIEGDNRINRPTDVAQRVILGILPSSFDWMRTAFECVDKSTGAILHCHDLVEVKPLPTNDERAIVNKSSSDAVSNNSIGKQSSASHSLINQSLSSSCSSQSALEKISITNDDKRSLASESDKDTSSPVLLERPTESCINKSNSSPPTIGTSEYQTSYLSNSSRLEDSISELPRATDLEMNAYELRAQTLIESIEKDVEDHDLQATLLHVQTVKSYAPHVNHVVFDIKIQPKSKTRDHYPPELNFSVVLDDFN